MNRAHSFLTVGSIAAAAVVAGAAGICFMLLGPSPAAQSRVPEDAAYVWDKDYLAGRQHNNPGTLIPGTGTASDEPGDWPSFRGPSRTDVALPQEKLLREWPAAGPEVLWKLDLGEGYGGAAVHKGGVYILDYDMEKREDAVRALSLADGKEIWRYTYYADVTGPHGKSRTVPAVNDDYVVTLGPIGNVTCLKRLTGELAWKMDLVRDCVATIPPWNAGECPLIDGDRVILAPGGNPLMMAVELATGKILWRTSNPGGWAMTHSSVAAMDFNGTPVYIYCTTRGVVFVRASDGKLLGKTDTWFIKFANIPTAVPLDESRVLLSGGYGAGAAIYRLTGNAESITPERVARFKASEFSAEQHTPILYNGYLYSIVEDGQLVCMDTEGKRAWASGTSMRFGLGPYLLADGMLLVLIDDQRDPNRDGTLTLVEATPSEFRLVASAKVLKGPEPWGPMALADGKLILRDLNQMLCVKVGTWVNP